MLAGSLPWTTMSTCAWMGTTLPLKTGWKSHIELVWPNCHTLDIRGSLGAGTILGGAGGSSVINSLKSYPDLIKKYQGLSKKPPELEKFGPIIELINTQNMKPAQVLWVSSKSQDKSYKVCISFFSRHFLENALASPSLFTITMSTEQGNVSQSEYFLASILPDYFEIKIQILNCSDVESRSSSRTRTSTLQWSGLGCWPSSASSPPSLP